MILALGDIDYKSSISLTIDVDWAPDNVVQDIINLLDQYHIKSTWFITHPSEKWDILRKKPEHYELGIHPNFLPGSTQGSNFEEIVSYLYTIVPDAKAFRMHSLYQHTPLLSQLRYRTGIEIDSSLFLPETPYLQPVFYLTEGKPLYRIPVYWADDYELMKCTPGKFEDSIFELPGLKVMIFHPIHVFLNTPSYAYYNSYKNKDKYCSQIDRYDGFGVRTIFIDFLEKLSSEKDNVEFLSNVVEEYKGKL